MPWGFNEDWGWSNGSFGGAAMANLHMQKAGTIMPDSLSANRFHVMWAYVEGPRGTYNWSMSDAQYAAMQKYTRKPIMLLVHAAVTRYPNVRAVEVWNEPNNQTFWSPAADPTRYAAILSAAHEAVRAAGSKAPVLLGGLVPATTDGTNMSAKEFLNQVYATAGANAFEGIGSHPYLSQAPYVDRMSTRLDALRAVRDQYGDSATPLWITEMGISTDPVSGVPLEQQGGILADLYHSIEGHDVRSFVIHRLYDVGSGYWGSVRRPPSGPDAEARLLRAGRGDWDRLWVGKAVDPSKETQLVSELGVQLCCRRSLRAGSPAASDLPPAEEGEERQAE